MTTIDSRTGAEAGEGHAPVRAHVDLDAQAGNWIAAYAAADAQIKHWEQVKAHARTQLEQRLGDAEEGRGADGTVVVRWTYVPSNRFDTSKFKAADPDTYRQFLVEGVTRRFTLVTPA